MVLESVHTSHQFYIYFKAVSATNKSVLLSALNLLASNPHFGIHS